MLFSRHLSFGLGFGLAPSEDINKHVLGCESVISKH